MKKISTIVLFCLLQSLVVGSALAEEDQVYLKRGAPINGAIRGTTQTQVAIESRGKNQTINVNEIRLIAFADEPQELRLGRAKAGGGKFSEGLDDLKRVNPAAIERDIMKRDLQFYLALCEGELALSAGGDKAKAAASMLAFVRAAPKSFHFFEAARLLGDLAAAQSDYASAAKYYGAIAANAPWPEYKMSASLSEARALLAQGSFPQAQQKFESVLGQQSDTPESKRQKLLAQVGMGQCLAHTGSPQEGIAIIEKIITDNEPTDSELFGRAYNAHGDCLLKAGRTKDALMAYLHVDVLFYSEADIHAESLYHLSKLWGEIERPDRAAAARNLLEQRYAGSGWADKD
jgi:tetratricopeptide (TPR) repeat protein